MTRLRETRVVGHALGFDVPSRTHRLNALGQNRNGVAHTDVEIAWFVGSQLVNEYKRVTRIVLAVATVAARRLRDYVGHAWRRASEVVRQVRAPATRDERPARDGVARFL